MSCKHPGFHQLYAHVEFAPGVESKHIDRHQDTGVPILSVFVAARRCQQCHHWLPLGEANDDDPRVALERDAAKRAAFNRETKYQPGYDRFDFCVDTNGGELCALCEALYLVGFINEDATHDQQEG